MHPIAFGSGVPTAVEHAPLQAQSGVVGALSSTLHVDAAAQAKEHVASAEHVAVALRGRHVAPRHEGEASGIQQGRDVSIVGERLRRGVHAAAAAVPESHLVAHHPALLLLVELHLAVELEAEVEAHADRRCDGVQAVRHDDRSRQRCGQAREQRFAQRGEVGVEERRLELACTEAGGRRDSVVHPRLLQDVAAAAGCVDAQVIVEPAESRAGEAQDGIRHGEARIGHIVLVVRLVQSLVVVVMVLASGLQEQIGLEDEASVARLKRESSVVGNAQHAVLHVDAVSLLSEVSTLPVVLLEGDFPLFLVLLGHRRHGEEGC